MLLQTCSGVRPEKVGVALHAGLAQLTFQASSGMYPSAETPVDEALAEFQYLLASPGMLKSVPPTETLYGVDVRPLTESPTSVERFSSQDEEPLSPDEVKTVIPCAEACW